MTRPLGYPLSKRVRFHQNLLAAGRLPEKRLLLVETREAGEGDARRLGLASEDAVVVSHSVTFSDGAPVALAKIRFPDARLPGLAVALGSHSGVTRALLSIGVQDYTQVSPRLTASAADGTQAMHLQVRENAPLLQTESLSRDQKGDPVEYGQTWFASERITLTPEHAKA